MAEAHQPSPIGSATGGGQMGAAAAAPGPFDSDAALSALLDGLLEGRNLSEHEAVELLGALTRPQVSAPMAAGLLVALRAKGVTAAELRGLARGLRAQARRPQGVRTAGAVDIVGTGGDRSGSLNLSTGAALLAAAAGVPIIKHGNRSVSSRAGSADVLQKLGLPMPLDEAAAGRCFQALGFTFLFAPFYHSATRHIAPVRAALGVRTVFNVLGPLSNPAAPPFLVLGAYRLDVAQLMAEALVDSGIERAFVIHGAEGWDEPTPVGPFVLFDVGAHGVRQERRTPGDYGLPACEASELAGGDAEHNAREMVRVLRGESRGAHRDALLLGAALALEVSGREPSPLAGVQRAAQAIDSGAAAQLLERLAQFGREQGGAATAQPVSTP